jgi:hypothetical protein
MEAKHVQYTLKPNDGPENEWQASEFEVDGKVGDTI